MWHCQVPDETKDESSSSLLPAVEVHVKEELANENDVQPLPDAPGRCEDSRAGRTALGRPKATNCPLLIVWVYAAASALRPWAGLSRSAQALGAHIISLNQ
jgi:hypothetical protein